MQGPVYCIGCGANVSNTIVYKLPDGYICDECEAAVRNQHGIEVESVRNTRRTVSPYDLQAMARQLRTTDK